MVSWYKTMQQLRKEVVAVNNKQFHWTSSSALLNLVLGIADLSNRKSYMFTCCMIDTIGVL